MQELLRVDNLCKRFGRGRVLDGITLSANYGEIAGVYGLSGSGKSVLLRILAGLEKPSSGKIFRTDRGASISFETPKLEENLSCIEYLWLCASVCGIPKSKRHAACREILSLFDLDQERDARISSLPDGARKLLDVGRCLISPFDLLLLDEPSAGLDFSQRTVLWEYLLRVRRGGTKCIMVAVSRPEEAELCDRLIILHEGRIIAEGTPSELKDAAGPEKVSISLEEASSDKRLALVCEEKEGELVLSTEKGTAARQALRSSEGVSSVRIRQRRLDSVLEHLIGSEGKKSRD